MQNVVRNVSKVAADRMFQRNPPPDVTGSLLFYIEAFSALGTERQYINGVASSIPVMKIIEYATWLGVDDIEQFVHIIQSMDYVHLEHTHEEMERQRKFAEAKRKRK